MKPETKIRLTIFILILFISWFGFIRKLVLSPGPAPVIIDTAKQQWWFTTGASNISKNALTKNITIGAKIDFSTPEGVVNSSLLATQLVETQGTEKAYAIFKTPNSKFNKDSHYFVVCDTSGTVRFHPNNSIVGRNFRDEQDINGNFFMREMIKASRSPNGMGWVEYYWPKPGDKTSSRKVSFVRRIKGTDLMVIAGIFTDKPLSWFSERRHPSNRDTIEITSITTQELVYKAELAVRLFGNLSEAQAIERIISPKGLFNQGGDYIVIGDMAAVVRGHPNRKLIGRSFRGFKDERGNAFMDKMVSIASSAKGNGWVEYYWPKPGEKAPSRKLSYILRVPGKELYAVSGFFTNRPLTEIKKEAMVPSPLALLIKKAALLNLFAKSGLRAGFDKTIDPIGGYYGPGFKTFILDYSGVVQAHPDTRLLGRDFSELGDGNQSRFERMLDMVKSNSSMGWLQYEVSSTGNNQVVKYLAHLSRIPGHNMFIVFQTMSKISVAKAKLASSL